MSPKAKEILDTIERIGDGELEARVSEEEQGELGEIGRAINSMARSLEEAEATREASRLEREVIERRLQRSQVLAAVSCTAEDIAHGIGSPLNTILGRARLAAGLPGCSQEVRGSLETIAAQCDRIARVVADMLATSRLPRESSVNVCDLPAVAEKAIAFMESEAAPRGVSLRLDWGGSSHVFVQLDEDRTFQILYNLCLNAIESLPRGGQVTLRIVPPSKGIEADPRVSFEVEDRPPIREAGAATQTSTQQSLSRCLDTPARIERAARDLRLALVRGLVSDTGRSIELMQGSGGGSTYRVTLRAKEASLQGPEAKIS